MKEILLTQGQVALIDEEDYELIKDYHWHTHTGRHTYYAMSNNKPHIRMHRLIMGVTNSDIKIDHINHDGLDNRRENLRLCTLSENQQNRYAIGGSSKYKGVSWSKNKNKWRTQIRTNGKNFHLGYFKDEVEAAKVYDKAAIQYHQEFACPNFGDK